jgi:hypothetical protein
MECHLWQARADFSIMMECTPESVNNIFGLTYEKENNTKM